MFEELPVSLILSNWTSSHRGSVTRCIHVYTCHVLLVNDLLYHYELSLFISGNAFFLKSVFFPALLIYKLHTIKFSILRCTIQWVLIYSQSCITITFNSRSIPFLSCPIWVIPINYHSLLPFVSPPPTSSPYQPEPSNSSETTRIPDPSYMKEQISQKWS